VIVPFTLRRSKQTRGEELSFGDGEVSDARMAWIGARAGTKTEVTLTRARIDEAYKHISIQALSLE